MRFRRWPCSGGHGGHLATADTQKPEKLPANSQPNRTYIYKTTNLVFPVTRTRGFPRNTSGGLATADTSGHRRAHSQRKRDPQP